MVQVYVAGLRTLLHPEKPNSQALDRADGPGTIPVLGREKRNMHYPFR